MEDILMELDGGTVGPGLKEAPIRSSHGQPWTGFFLKEHGPTRAEVKRSMLLKHVVCLQLESDAQLEWESDGNSVSKVIRSGEVSIYPANRLYSGSVRHDGRRVLVFLEPGFVAQVTNRRGTSGTIELSWVLGVESPILRELVMALRAEVTRKRSGDGHYAEAIARLIAAHLVEHHSNRSRTDAVRGGLGPARLHRVIGFINAHLDDDFTLEMLAREAGLTVFHFARAFKQSTGRTPFQYLMECRVLRAKELLLRPFVRIGEVAVACGFCDQAHLTRHFKRVVGVTPGVFIRDRSVPRTSGR